jgi:hypothetical protein
MIVAKVGETKSCFWTALARSGGDHQQPKIAGHVLDDVAYVDGIEANI